MFEGLGGGWGGVGWVGRGVMGGGRGEEGLIMQTLWVPLRWFLVLEI